MACGNWPKSVYSIVRITLEGAGDETKTDPGSHGVSGWRRRTSGEWLAQDVLATAQGLSRVKRRQSTRVTATAETMALGAGIDELTESLVAGFFCSYDARPDSDFDLAAKAASPAAFMRPDALSAEIRRMLMLLQCEPHQRGVQVRSRRRPASAPPVTQLLVERARIAGMICPPISCSPQRLQIPPCM